MKNRKIEVFWFIGFSVTVHIMIPSFLFAQTSIPNSLHAAKLDSEIKIDGFLDEPAWMAAEKISNFTQRELIEGNPVSEKTAFSILYDENNLYFGVWAFDSEADKITAQEMKRDFGWGSDDNFMIILSTHNDRRNGYLFVINPNGAFADVLITDEGNGSNKDWNCVWEVRTKILPEGWFAEGKIPFSSLKFPKAREQTWALNLERNIRRKKEQVLWQGWSRNYSLTKISQAGELVGLENIVSKKLYEIKPFVSGGIAKQPGSKLDRIGKIGGDFNYLLTSNMKLNLTINTDFSQVESDRAQINLSRFSISYPEKREFFLEGQNLFEMDVGSNARTFYTRQIGIHNGEAVPILGGVKVIGKVNKTNIGLLSIQADKKGELATTNYSVIRLKQDILSQSNIGMILTSKNNSQHYNYVYGIDANYNTSKLLGNKNLELGGVLSQSFTKDETNVDNYSYSMYLSYPNDKVEYDLSVETIKKDYNPEVGFLRRKNYTKYYTELQFNPRPSFLPWIKQMEIKPIDLNYYVTEDTKQIESIFWEWRPIGFQTKSGDFVEFNINRVFDRLDEPYEIIEEVVISRGDYWYNQYELQVESFGGRKLTVDLGYNWGEYYTGTRKEIGLDIGWNLNKHLNISGDWQRNGIELADAAFVTHEVGSRIEYEFNSSVYASMFGQWNNEDDEVVLNYRINWIPGSGSYFYFVVNQEFLSESGSFKLKNTTALTKLIWLF